MPDQPPSEPIRDYLLERPLPSAPDAERASIGAVILDNTLIAQLVELLKPADYYVPSHRKIFSAMVALFERGAEINQIFIADELRRTNNLESAGGILFLTGLTFGLPHVTSVEGLAKIIKGKAVLRQLIKAANKITAEALEDEDLPEHILEHSIRSVFDISLEHTPKSFTPIEVLTHRSLDKAYAIQQSGKALTGITTGFSFLDSLTLGWQKSDLILIAGRPSMGKTALGLSLAINAAKAGASVAFFSLEMPEEQIAMRALCGEARIDSRKYRAGYLNDGDWHNLSDAHEALAPILLAVDDAAAISVSTLKAKAMRYAAELKQLDMIVVDYLGLMTDAAKSLYEQATNISRGLKSVAKELKIPLLALCQLNRGPENRTDHRPTLADLRESGALEQDADQVAFIYRQDKYRPANEPKDNVAEIILAKNRNGPCDTVYLRFDDAFAKFDNLQRQN